MKKIKRALISVYDKNGIVEFARSLSEMNVEIISTGGTEKLLKDEGVKVTPVSEITGEKEMLDGRVKTLHPKIHGAILAKRNNTDHLGQLSALGINLIDMVVVNLYPFAEVIAKPNVTLDEALENIDIGGPTMIRAAAKNFVDVAVITSPGQYEPIISELSENAVTLSHDTFKDLSLQAFRTTFQYDGLIAEYLTKLDEASRFSENITLTLEKIQNLRYGENPHQQAAFYRETGHKKSGVTGLEQLHGKELSFNNIMDLDAVVKMVKMFEKPCSVIVKHSNPCGVAVGDDLHSAFTKAFATDSVSAFGGIYGFNRKLDLATAEELMKIFIEVVIAPEFNDKAFKLLSKKKNLRLLKLDTEQIDLSELSYKKVAGGVLLQEEDALDVEENKLKVVTQRKPTEEEVEAMRFAWKVVKWVKSNAVVFCLKDRTVGIGAGQMSRVDSSMFAVDKAKRAGLSLKGTVVASDAFFPFRDGVDAAVEAGATAIIQPGGSIRDEEVIQAANEHDVAMVFTGIRHFRH